MLSLYAYLPTYFSTRPNPGIGDIEIPGLWTIPSSSVLPGLDDEENFLTQQILANSRIFPKADGILINTFEAIESRTLAALNARRVTPDLPPVLAIGPLQTPPIYTHKNDASIKNGSSIVFNWLDSQPKQSVLYVSFGSRTAMSKEQIKQLAIGLEKSQCRFLWIIKTKKVDREEQEVEIESMLGEGYVERVKEKGLVINGWVEQEEILRHGSIGGFLSHCGWNSVLEAWAAGVRVIAWPRGADQRVNGEVVRRCRAGVWMEEWKWEVEEGVVEGEEIGKGVKEVMEDEGLKERVERVREDSLKAVEVGGSSDKALGEFIGRFKE